MTDLLRAIGKHVAESIKNQPEPETRTEMMLYMYNRVDRRSKAYRDWVRGKLSLSEAYAKAGGREIAHPQGAKYNDECF